MTRDAVYSSAMVVTALALPLLALAWVGCAPQAGEHERPATSIVLPEGNHEAGRQAFMSLGCALCHRAAGDRGMPAPASAGEGPVLGPAQAGQTTEWLVDSILNPSHRLPDELRSEVESPMVAYTDITFRQLSDVVAYLRYLGD